jgi:hypothetical protein
MAKVFVVEFNPLGGQAPRHPDMPSKRMKESRE